MKLVEPQSSGLGGGAFVLYWDAQQKRLYAYNGRETAPAALREKHFLDAAGKSMSFREAAIGGHSVGVPGVPALLEQLHQRHGRLGWRSLFTPAIRLARQGFPVSPRLNLLLRYVPQIGAHPSLRNYLLDADGQALAVGTMLKNPEYADTLREFARHGAETFYRGEIAADIVRAVREDPLRPGLLQAQDLADYRVLEAEPLCREFRDYRVCGMPPPSSGGSTVLAILGILQNFDTRKLSPDSFAGLHLFAEASRLAFADRNTYLADPDFVAVPTASLLNREYLRRRAAQIKAQQAMQQASPGDAPPFSRQASSAERDSPSTTHLSLIDRHGNAISMTSSIEGAFGSRILVRGFLLNQQLTDFSFIPASAQGEAIANRPQAGKRPRSSMAPTIVLQEGRPVLLIGSPGGARIIDYVARILWLYLEGRASLAEALQSGHVVHRNGARLELEQGRYPAALQAGLQGLGHTVVERRHSSGVHAIEIRTGALLGVADPRREGTAAGL